MLFRQIARILRLIISPKHPFVAFWRDSLEEEIFCMTRTSPIPSTANLKSSNPSIFLFSGQPWAFQNSARKLLNLLPSMNFMHHIRFFFLLSPLWKKNIGQSSSLVVCFVMYTGSFTSQLYSSRKKTWIKKENYVVFFNNRPEFEFYKLLTWILVNWARERNNRETTTKRTRMSTKFWYLKSEGSNSTQIYVEIVAEIDLLTINLNPQSDGPLCFSQPRSIRITDWSA